jgi:GT2 family glycosyltransferase
MRVYGVLVTYRRPELLRTCIDRISTQTRQLTRLIVVDNHADGAAEVVCGSYPTLTVDYRPAPGNLGPAGGFALGIERILAEASDEDVIVLFDDNDPLPTDDVLDRLVSFFGQQAGADPTTAGVGVRGATFDWQRARAVRVPDEATGAVPVDHLYGGYAPMYRVGSVRGAGSFSPALFWGFEELDFGLRLVAAGHSLYMNADLWREVRANVTAQDPLVRPRLRLEAVSWRRYYTLRNLLFILISNRRRPTALRIAMVRGFGKPLVNLVATPSVAWAQLQQNAAAVRDAFRGRMGLTVVPDDAPRSTGSDQSR